MLIRVTVIPKAKKNVVTQLTDERYEVRLKAEPERNEANVLLIKVLAEYWDVDTTAITIISGHHTRHKRVEVSGGER